MHAASNLNGLIKSSISLYKSLEHAAPFRIALDRDSEAELRDLYGEVGYTIIDDVLNLPERMPAIYRRLTT